MRDNNLENGEKLGHSQNKQGEVNRCVFICKRLPGVAENFPENSAAKMKVMPADYFMIWESSARRT